MRIILISVLAAACAHAPPPPPAEPHPELVGVTLSVAPQTELSDPGLADLGAQLRAALAKAFAAEGFRVADSGGLLATTSIDYAPWTTVSAGSLYIVVRLSSGGVSVDQVELQKINEAFPEPAKVPALAHSLAHALATSPRLKEFLVRK